MTTSDPFDSAANSTWSPIRTFFGHVNLNVWFCALEKGRGKIPFDPAQHSPDRRFTAIDFDIQPLSGSKSQFPVQRNMLAESREWAQITLPSLKALNVDLRNMNGKYAKVNLVPSGRKYTDSKDGTEKESTEIKFVAIYDTEDACHAALDQHFGASGNGVGDGSTVAGSASTVDPERATAGKFLGALWQASAKDPERFAKMIANDAILAKHFTMTSPEVVAAMAPAAA